MINDIKNFYRRLTDTPKPLAAGVHHYQTPPNAANSYRIHLRVERDGTGILIVNAATVLHLNATACEYAYHLIKETPLEKVISDISHRYQIHPDQVKKDFQGFKEKIDLLLSTIDLDPVTIFNTTREEVNSANLSAPLRLDCALTYHTSEDYVAGSTPLDRVDRELIQPEWEKILTSAWQAGIPHVIFTGGEPTLRPDLPDLIQYAENLGMVSGLLSDGLRFSEPEFLEKVLQAGLDHVMVIYNQQNENARESLRDLLSADLFVTVHLTITDQNQASISNVIRDLAEKDVKSLSLSINSPDLKSVLAEARDLAAFYQLSLVWDLPVPYSNLNPVRLELEEFNENISGAGKAWMYVEPDGDVFLGQGFAHKLGNLLTDAWEQIWTNAQDYSE